MENNSKKTQGESIHKMAKVSLGFGAIFLLVFGVTSLQSSPQLSDEEILTRGLNEYIDPSESPIYELYYTTVTFKEGITLDDVAEMQEYVPLMGRNEEKQAQIYTRMTDSDDYQAVKLGKDIIESRKAIADQRKNAQQKGVSVRDQEESEKVYSISLNHEKNDQAVEVLRSFTDEKANVPIDVKESIQTKRTQGNSVWNRLESEIETVNTAENKELMDIIYPPQEQIDILNQEIIEERQMALEFDRAKEREPREMVRRSVKNVLNFIVNPAQALNNFHEHLFIYSDYMYNLTMEVPNNDRFNGQVIKLNYRNGSYAQDFYFEDATNRIKFFKNDNKCLDLKDGVHWVNGQPVQVWDCHGGDSQKWELWPDRTIRFKLDKTKCLDASSGVNAGSQIKIWNCSANDNQRFLVGENDFSNMNTGRYIRIQSSDTEGYTPDLIGHSSVSVGKRNLNNKQCWTTNTFGSWAPWNIEPFVGPPDYDDINTNGKTNNIATGTHINVDRDEDWENAINNKSAYRYRDLSISKRRYDEAKYMNGYYTWWKDFWNDSVTTYHLNKRNCSVYARDLWFTYTNEWLKTDEWASDPDWQHHTPGMLYNSIGGRNWDNQSQCYTGSLQY